MLIELIERDAEEKLLEAIAREGAASTRVALHFAVAGRKPGLHVADLVPLVWPALEHQKAAMYLLPTGDVVVAWDGQQPGLTDQLRQRFYTYYGLSTKDGAEQYYELRTDSDNLRKKLIKKPPAPVKAEAAPAYELSFTEQQLQHMKRYSAERRTLVQPTILVVEDQEFSRKLLAGMLGRKYTCHFAANAEEAVALYGEHLPCITFLDIELPQCDGHQLAAFFRQHDPGAFIVMLTANHYEKDVKAARENRVNGFIAKPFSKQKILDAIEGYKHFRK